MHEGYSIVVATILYVVIGFAWYSKHLFGDEWKRLAKVSKDKNDNFAQALIGMIVIALIQAYFLSGLVMQFKAYNLMDGARLGFMVWLGFVATTKASGLLWHKVPFKLYAINAGYYLVAYLAMGAAIGHLIR